MMLPDKQYLSDDVERSIMAMLDPSFDDDVEDARLREEARTSLKAFVLYTMPSFQLNWHHDVIFEYLEKWIAGEITRLMVFAGPQTGKSRLVSRHLPAYLLGRFPDDQILTCSYNDGWASELNLDCQKVIDDDRYRHIFPGTTLAGKAARKTKGSRYSRTGKKFDVVSHEGSLRSAGVGGGVTGKPMKWGIIDDPYKNEEEAQSPAIRQKIWDWYVTTFSTRKSVADTRILLTLTRWSHLDMAGQLLELMRKDPNAEQWTVVKFPDILETEAQRQPYDKRQIGEALFPARRPLKELLADKANMTPSQWSALHQQEPTPATGVVFHPEKFRYFAEEIEGGELYLLLYPGRPPELGEPKRVRAADCSWFQTADAGDVASAGSSWTCVATFARTPEGDLLVWHVWRARLEYPKRYAAVLALREGLSPWDPYSQSFLQQGFVPWPQPLAYQALEAKASGLSMIQQGAADGKPFRPLKPGVQGKAQRAAAASVLYENGKAYHRLRQPWLTDFENELATFPSGTANDQGDVLAYAGIVITTDAVLGASARGGGELILSGAGGGEESFPRDAYGQVSVRGTSAAYRPPGEDDGVLDLGEGRYLLGGHVIDFGPDD
jgi:hypothetical protein